MKRLSLISIVMLGGCASILVNSKIVELPRQSEPVKSTSQVVEPLRTPPVASKPLAVLPNIPPPKTIPVVPQVKLDVPQMKQVQATAIDKRCEILSGYARAVAGLRDVGVLRDALPPPPASSFPMRVLQDDVYARDDINPEQMGVRYNDFCSKHGFDNMLQIVEAENIRRPDDAVIRKNGRDSILVPINKDQPVTDPVTP